MILLFLLGCVLGVIGNSGATCQGTAKPFYPMSDSSILLNPGKGFYTVYQVKTSKFGTLDANDLIQKMNTDKISLVLLEFVLDKYVKSDINQTHINKMRQDFNATRSAGFMCIVRFSYTQAKSNTNDAELSQLKNHVAQVADMLQSNADIILALQAGFIGAWGEWCFSKNYAIVNGDSCTFTASHLKDRNEVLRTLLRTLPSTRQIQVRTPSYKQSLCGSSNLDPSKAFGTSDCARIGLFNDCFMASDDDSGTFSGPDQRNWLKTEGLYTIVGGEPCNNNKRNDCGQNKSPPAEIFNQRFTYLNRDYNETGVVAKWESDGCYKSMANALGYRFVLTQGIFPSSASKGKSYCATLTVKNTGAAPIYIPHNVEVLLRQKGSANILAKFNQQGIDIRKWAPGAQSTFDINFTVPSNLASGTYDVLLSLPDASSTLAGKANYRVLFANSNGVQDLRYRYNILTQITI